MHLFNFCKIVICKGPDFSKLWFFSSISFKCHLWNKFRISDEGEVRFWKKYFLKIGPQGGLHNFTRNLNVFLDILKFRKEYKKLGKNFFDNVVSDWQKYGLMWLTNWFFYVHFQVFKVYVFLLICTYFSNWFHVLIQPF